MENQDSVKVMLSAERVAKCLRCFSPNCPNMSLKSISEMLALPKSTTHRILKTLEMQRLIEQDEHTGYYRLGSEVMRLGEVAKEGLALVRIADRTMQWLAEESYQTSNLYVIQDYQRLCIAQVIGFQYVQRISRVGILKPLYAGATGKVLLAYQSDDWIDAFFKAINVTALTQDTCIDQAQIYAQLQKVREDGYCYSYGESEPGAASIAAPIHDYSGKIVATVSISGPVSAFEQDKLERFTALVKEGGRRISAHLGYIPLT